MEDAARPPSRLAELAWLFFRLGVIGFGGPAAHIAMMRDEVVEKRKWISEQHFLDLVGATNLIPGPNSTEMAIHVGYQRGGFAGLCIAGTCFILPAFVMTTVLAWVYLTWGVTPEATDILVGIKAVVLALILVAVGKLGQKAVKNTTLAAIGVAVAVAASFGVPEIAAMLGGGVLGMFICRLTETRSPEQANGHEKSDAKKKSFFPPLLGWVTPATDSGTKAITTTAVTTTALASSTIGIAASPPLWAVFLFFLKVGAILYGGGYVLIAFLEGEITGTAQQVADGTAWLTYDRLVDAIAIGQVTPGPVLTTATSIGFMLGGVEGDPLRGLLYATIATLGIFLPSFVFVLILNPLVPKLRKNAWLSAFLDAVNVSALALMVVVAVRMGGEIITGWPVAVIAAAALLAHLYWKLNAVWMVLVGGLIGLTMQYLI